MMARFVVAAFFFTATTDLCLQSFLASFVSYDDTSNPYVYSQPAQDVLKIAARVEQVSEADPTGRKMPVWVVCTAGDYWPLPWYLRSFENVGWWNDVNEIRAPAPVVIAQADLEERLINRLYDVSPPGQKNLYVPLFENYIELRPGVELRGYIIKDLLDNHQKSNAEH
jgi:predicted membrane-bound mannosyltransferase